MSGELQPTLGDIRPHGHLKLGRFTQHFVDVLDLSQTPLDFFTTLYPNDPREEQRKYLGRFGISGKMQVQKMEELSDGQKSRVVFAKLGRDVPHILLLDEPTNHLDMESIDALAKAVNEFNGGLILVSHDMRLISQVAQEIWICDHKRVTKYKGDIQNFKMDMRSKMGMEGHQKGVLRGDASKKVNNSSEEEKSKISNVELKKTTPVVKTSGISSVSVPSKAKLEVLKPASTSKLASKTSDVSDDHWGSDEEANDYANKSSSTFSTASINKSLPHVDPSPTPASTPAPAGRYIPPHLRNRS
jgi:ATP-binding cassette subfamily F protein 2